MVNKVSKYENEIKNLGERLESEGIRYLILLEDGNYNAGSVRMSAIDILSAIIPILVEKLSAEKTEELFEDAKRAVRVREIIKNS